jgi:hypothetical protein
MSKQMLNMQLAAAVAAGAAALSSNASNTAFAMPLARAVALSEAARPDVVPVWWYREWGSGSGPVYEPAAPYHYRSYYYRSYSRYYDSYYDDPPRTYRYDDYDDAYDRYPVPRYGSAAAYCASRYRSWDPETRTYLGYDGLSHPCP